MRRPQDPRNHGLKEPKKTITKSDKIEFDASRLSPRISLHTIVDAWNKAIKDHDSQGHRITDGPYIMAHSWDNYLWLEYTYEWSNLNYEAEKAEFDAAMAAYLEKHRAFQEFLEKEKNSSKVPNIDEKIARTERRLANLKAAKAGEPLPYPED